MHGKQVRAEDGDRPFLVLFDRLTFAAPFVLWQRERGPGARL